MNRVILAYALCAVVWATQASAQSGPVAVFSRLDSAVAARAADSVRVVGKGVWRRQYVGMRLDRLFDGRAKRVTLNVDGREWIASLDRLDSNVHGHRTWVGSIEGVQYSHVSFAERDGVVSGLINAVDETFAVRTVAPGVYTLDRVLDVGAELEPVTPDLPQSAASAVDSLEGPSDDGRQIDVLLLYTPGARSAVGGTAQINALVAQIISDTNTIFSRSGIVPRVRLVGTSEMSLPETADMAADLNVLTSSPAVTAARDAVGADLVQLIQNSPSTQACGVGWLLRSTANPSTFPAFSIVDYACVSQYTPTHELAHNMGSHHAPEDGAGGALFSYSYGYKDPVRGFRTVMAYACSGTYCPRIANLSSPSITHNNFPTGSASQHNALSINNAASIVANFRQSIRPVVTPPRAPEGLTSLVSGLNATLSWKPVLADSSGAVSGATGYMLQVGSAPGSYDLLALSLGNTTAVSGSAPPGTYYWRVVGTNSAGVGAPSVEAQFTIGGCTAPTAPQNFTYTLGAGRQVTLSWSPPAAGAEPISYAVDVGSAPGHTNILSAPVGTTTSLSVTAPPGTYYVRVRAANSCASSSPPSNERVIAVP